MSYFEDLFRGSTVKPKLPAREGGNAGDQLHVHRVTQISSLFTAKGRTDLVTGAVPISRVRCYVCFTALLRIHQTYVANINTHYRPTMFLDKELIR